MIEINSFVLRGRAVVLDKVVMRNILIVSFKIDQFLRDIRGFKIKGELRHSGRKLSQAGIESIEERGGEIGFELPWKLPKGKYTIVIKLLNNQGRLVDSLSESYDYSLFNAYYARGERKKKPRFTRIEHKDPTPPPSISTQDKERGYLTFHKHYLWKVYPNTVPQKKELTQKLSVTSARNEFEPITFSIYPLKDLGEVSISLTDLVKEKGRGKIPKSEIVTRVVRMLPERINPDLSADYRLAPRLLEKKSKVKIRRKETTRFWLTLRVKEKVKPGDYSGQILIRPQKGKPSRIELHLRVLPFKLVSPPHMEFSMMMTYAFYELQGNWSPKEKALIRKSGYKIYQDFKDHGMTAVYPHCHFYFKRKANGEFNLDDLKACLEAAKKVGFKRPVYWSMSHLIQTAKHKHSANIRNYDPAIHLERAKELARYVQRLCRKNRWPEVVFQPIDEPSGAHEPADEVRIGIAREAVRAMKEVPGVKVLVVGGIGAGLGDPKYKLDIAVENIRRLKDIPQLKKQGTKFWIYSNGAVRCHNPAYSRYMYGFHPWRWQIDGMSSWTYQKTQNISGEPFAGSALTGDTMTAFPSPDGPIPTPLWEAVREGIDDYKYIYQLEQLIKKGKKAKLPEASKAERELEKIKKNVMRGRPGPMEGEYRGWKPEVFDKRRAKVVALILKLREKIKERTIAVAKLRVVACIFLLFFLGSLPGGLLAQGEERLLLGFEKGELAKWTYKIKDISEKMRKSSIPKWEKTLEKLTQNKDPENLYFPETSQALNSTYPDYYAFLPNHFFIHKGNSTEGDYAMIRWFSSSYKLKASGDTYPPNPYNRRTDDLFNTFGYATTCWFRKAFPQDWKGFDLLWLDIFSPDTGLKIKVILEDEIIDPPIERRFHVPKGKWVTLEVDLAKAVEVRGLNLARMVNLLIMLDGTQENSDATHLLIDNIRLAKKGAKPNAPIICDKSPHKSSPPEYAIELGERYRWQEAPIPKEKAIDIEPDRSPIKMSEPMLIDPGKGGELSHPYWRKTAIAALDNQRLILPLWIKSFTLGVLITVDGGATWKGLDGGDKPTVISTGGPATSGITATGRGELFLTKSLGCCGYGYPADRLFSRRIYFDGESWQLTPFFPLDSDLRHCTAYATTLRLKKGRIWSAWGHYGRVATTGIHAKYSDDNGHTWHSWQGDGKCARIPGSDADESTEPYGKKEVFLTPYENYVACLWHDRLGMRWSYFDGKEWSPAEVIEAKVRDFTADREGSAVTLGDKDIYLSLTQEGLGLYYWDGKEWHHDQSKSGFLSITQDKLFLFNKSGNKIECWQKKVGGAWQGPKTIISDEKPIDVLAVPPYSPPNFIPLAWTLEGGEGIRVLKVPAP